MSQRDRPDKAVGCFLTAMKRVALCLGVFLFISSLARGEGIRDRFAGGQKLSYKVSFNGIPSGTIEWEYLGRGKVGAREADILAVSSDTKVMNLLNLVSDEKVFLDAENHLPLKVERDIVLFGKKELIEEFYDQESGCVKIVRTNKKTRQDLFYPPKPIHNILALLYFFPKDVELEKKKWMIFNLPTRKLKIKFIKERKLSLGKKKVDTYFLIGRGAKRVSLWMDKVQRLPLRLEFIFPVGKIIITRQD